MRQLNIRHWSNYQKYHKKTAAVDFHSATLVYPLHPQMGADEGRSQVLIHFCCILVYEKTFTFIKKRSSQNLLTSTPPDFLLSGVNLTLSPLLACRLVKVGGTSILLKNSHFPISLLLLCMHLVPTSFLLLREASSLW